MNEAEQAASAGMGQAIDHADRVSPGWSDLAYDYLIVYCLTHSEFKSEDVSGSTKGDPFFPQPPTDRAWGAIYRRALKDGVIAHNGTARSELRHNTICPYWRSLILGKTPNE